LLLADFGTPAAFAAAIAAGLLAQLATLRFRSLG